MTIEIINKTCPHCKAKMPINFGFITWCDQCGYNLENSSGVGVSKPKGMFPRLWAWMGKRSGEALFKKACHLTDFRPKMNISIVLGFLVALVVHCFTLLLIITAVTWLVWAVRDWGLDGYRFYIFARIIGAVILLLLAWKVRPHIGKIKPGAVRREQAGESGLAPLFVLTDRISDTLGSARIQAIQITPEFTAGMGQVGWKRERILWIGLPLLITLDRQEMIGLLSHEISHNVNGDPQRTWVIGSAIHTLMEWSDLFFIDKFVLIGGWAGLLNLVIMTVMRLLSVFTWLGASLIAFLLYPNMQNAEYRADAIAARLAGTDSLLRLMRKVYLRQSTDIIYQKAFYFPETHIMQEIHDRLCNVPDREWLRIERLIDLGESRLDDSHPTTKHRIASLRSRPMEMGQIALSNAEYGQIMEGLKGFEDRIEHEIRIAMAQLNKKST